MHIHLKVKICTLAAEAKIIRQQEQRLTRFNTLQNNVHNALHIVQEHEKNVTTISALRTAKKLLRARRAKVKMGQVWGTLHEHRRGIVRFEARHNLLAYGFLRGRNYLQVERSYHIGNAPKWDKVFRIALRFSNGIDERDLKQKFEEWVQNGKNGDQSKIAAE
jgi:hypothetical protein